MTITFVNLLSKSCLFLLTVVVVVVVYGQYKDINLGQIKQVNPDLGKELEYYDVNSDGILNTDEIELSYDSIQNIFNKHDKLTKLKESKNEKPTAQQSKPGNKPPQQKDGINSGKKTEIRVPWLSAPVIISVLIGGTVIAFVIYLTQQKNTNGEQFSSSSREEWLNKFSKPSTSSTSNTTQTQPIKPDQTSLRQSQPDSSSLLSETKESNESKSEIVSKAVSQDLIDNDQISKPDVLVSEDNKQLSNNMREKKLSSDVSSPKTQKHTQADSFSEDRGNISKLKTSPEVKDTGQSSRGHVYKESRSQPTESMEVKNSENDPDETETSVQMTLLQFLEDVLNCQIEVKNSKTRYSLGFLTINQADYPEHADNIPTILSAILEMIIPRQINKIKYVLSCYERCDANSHHIQHDDVIKTAFYWLKLKTANTILDTFNSDGARGGMEEDDLWSDYGGPDPTSDAEDFLWRIASWSKDGVFVSPRLLKDCLDYTYHGDKSVSLLSVLVHAGCRRIQKLKRLDEMFLQEMNTLNGLEILLNNVNVSQVLAAILQNEIESAEENLGIYYENNSIFGSIMSASSVPSGKKTGNVMSLSGNSVLPFLELQRKSSQVMESDLRMLEKSIQDGFHRCQDIIYKGLKKVVSDKNTRDSGLCWVASVIQLNDIRTASLQLTEAQRQTCCSDGFMLNFCAVLLKFFLPIYGNAEKTNKIDLKYATSASCRLNYQFETCLASGQIVSEKEKSEECTENEYSFITECYHLTQRALGIGLIPALIHYNHMHRDFNSKLQSVIGTPQEKDIKDMHMLLTMMWDTSLADTELIKNVTMFYLTQAQVLLNIAEKNPKEERLLFQQVPEYCVKDMAIWFSYVAGHAIHLHKGILWGLPLSPYVDCCVMLLERPNVMPGPIVASKLVASLLQFVQTSANKNRRSVGWESTTNMSDLALMVHTSKSVQSKLGPALLHTYISVDVVEGLDVDKDEFDKYTARAQISQLIKHLWNRPDCRQHILKQHQTEEFQNFLGAILDTLLYMLHDALSRMANVKRLESAKDDENEWNSLSEKEKQDKTNFLLNEEHAGRGFMAFANQTLDFILLLTEEEVVSKCFNHAPLSNRSASAICGFLLSLCGTKAKDYKVKNMSKYNFDPKRLLTNIVKIILCICQQDSTVPEGFIRALAMDSDFEIETFEKAHGIIYTKGLTNEEFVIKFAHLIDQLKEIKQTSDLKSDDKRTETDWMTDAAMLEIDTVELEESYIKTMSSLRFETAVLLESHSYHNNIQSLDPGSQKVKYLMKEMKQLQQSLPVHPNAAIYVRQDEDRMDLMRTMITGPVDTPYSLGCFLFDVYFPSSYPNNPPLIKLITTGNGTVRFNPNLYSDGKVCLSLLGTWHGDASEKWNAGKSTLHQVLVSIQSIILTSDPMFNEPGYDGMRDTQDGKKESIKYNWKIQLQTLRHAILENIKHPPPGFQEVIYNHYLIQKNSLLKQCSDWIAQCEDEDLVKRMKSVSNDIHQQLANIIPVPD